MRRWKGKEMECMGRGGPKGEGWRDARLTSRTTPSPRTFPGISFDQLLDFLADALAEISHAAAEDLSSPRPLGGELEQGLAIKGHTKAPIFGFLARTMCV